VARRVAACRLDRGLGLGKGGAHRGSSGQCGVEAVGEGGGGRIVDGLGRGDHGRDARLQQRLHLRLGRAAVEEDQF
jgi:hypothetical protein